MISSRTPLRRTSLSGCGKGWKESCRGSSKCGCGRFPRAAWSTAARTGSGDAAPGKAARARRRSRRAGESDRGSPARLRRGAGRGDAQHAGAGGEGLRRRSPRRLRARSGGDPALLAGSGAAARRAGDRLADRFSRHVPASSSPLQGQRGGGIRGGQDAGRLRKDRRGDRRARAPAHPPGIARAPALRGGDGGALAAGSGRGDHRRARLHAGARAEAPAEPRHGGGLGRRLREGRRAARIAGSARGGLNALPRHRGLPRHRARHRGVAPGGRCAGGGVRLDRCSGSARRRAQRPLRRRRRRAGAPLFRAGGEARLRGDQRRRARARPDRGVHRCAMGPRLRRQPARRVSLRPRGVSPGRTADHRHRLDQRHPRRRAFRRLQREQVGAHRTHQVARRGRARAAHLLRGGAARLGGYLDAEEDPVRAGDEKRGRGAGGEISLHRGAVRDDRERRRGVRMSLPEDLSALGLQVARDLAPYERDESGCGIFPPTAAVLARNAEEVQTVLRYSREKRIPVIPRGAGSGKSGGALAEHGGIVLSLEKMNRILEVSRADMVAVVEPGVILEKLQQAVEAEGLFYPPDPNSQAMCAIGGNLAHNAGGPRALKYGVTRDYVLGLKAVLPTGELIKCGHRSWKGVAGYDLTQLLVGSEGTLAVIVEATLKLIPLPRSVATMLAFFPDEDAAALAVQKIFGAGLLPRACELLDGPTMRAVSKVAPFKFPENIGGALIVEHDGHGDGVFEELAKSGEMCTEAGAQEVVAAQDESQRRKIWETRRQISVALSNIRPFKISEDV